MVKEKLNRELSAAISWNLRRASSLLDTSLEKPQREMIREAILHTRRSVQSKLGSLLENHQARSSVPIIKSLNAMGWGSMEAQEIDPNGVSLFVYSPSFLYGAKDLKFTHPFYGICLVKPVQKNGEFQFRAVPIVEMKLSQSGDAIEIKPSQLSQRNEPLHFIHQPQRKDIHFFYRNSARA